MPKKEGNGHRDSTAMRNKKAKNHHDALTLAISDIKLCGDGDLWLFHANASLLLLHCFTTEQKLSSCICTGHATSQGMDALANRDHFSPSH
eukprot:1138374-Pelagomonas_calceolata.AAC.3